MANTTEPATLADLPVEMVCEVLRGLSLADLVRLKMTAKRYRQIVCDFRVKQLEVQEDAHNKSNQIYHCHPNLFVLQLAQPTLSHLRHLTIGVQLNHFDFNELNRLNRLMQLKIACVPMYDKVCLNLPDLRQLEIICNEKCELKIDSTKLEKLVYYGPSDLLQVEHPETVLSLDSDLPAERLRSFQNLRHLRSSSNLRILDERTLLDLPNLKEIAYTGTYDDVWEAFDEDERIADLSPYLKRFMAKKKALGRADLKVQFVSFELVDHKPIEDYKFDKFFYDYHDRSHGSFLELDLHAHNYDQLIGTFSVPYLAYAELIQAFNGRLPADLFSKFVDIYSVGRTYSLNEKRLLWLLQSVPELKHFESSNETLSESFFRRLTESCSESLHSMELRLKGLEKLRDLDFAGEFKALHSLTLGCPLSPAEIRLLLNMSWPSKRQFHLKFWHHKDDGRVQYAVMRRLNSEEAFLYRGEHHFLDPRKQIVLKTCSLDCLGELADYFEDLQSS